MLGIVKKIISGDKLLDSARGIIDEIVTSKEEKAELLIKLEEMFTKHKETAMNAELEDRKTARLREVETTKAGSKNFTQNILAYIGVVAFFAITGYVLSRGLGNMSAEESFIIGNLTGMAGAIAKDVYGYYFGSSKGESDHKNFLREETKADNSAEMLKSIFEKMKSGSTFDINQFMSKKKNEEPKQ